MLSRDHVRQFVDEWLTAWNGADLPAIMSHYEDDVEFSSPLIAKRLGRPSGKIHGAAELRAYFQSSLSGEVPPRFTLSSIAIGTDSFAIIDENHRSQTVVETFFPRPDMKIFRVCVCWVLGKEDRLANFL